ncbi:MAG: carboxypeptidase regulatory-like domain-containing protein [Gemmatimonadetes bacterium]|nr:carboxypeptidase regulatory-like domain-containing protein [Gemmatimonadota bacterium]
MPVASSAGRSASRFAWLVAVAVTVVALGRSAAAQQSGAKGLYTAHPAIVSGRIVGPDKKGIEDVEVLIGDSVSALTDRKGYFEIDPVDPGVHDVLVRKIGLVPLRFRVAVTAGDLWDGTITMTQATQSLPAVVVLDSTKSLKNFRPQWIDGFVERRRVGLGTFFDRLDIEHARQVHTANLLALAPGIHTRPGFGYDELTASRCGVGTGQKAILFVDGLKTESSTNGRFYFLDSFPPETLWGIEIFRGHGTIPPQYEDPQACLVILFWTRHR